MEKTGLVNLLNEMLIPLGFKKKGNYWVINGEEISKMVNLQKSQFGNFFYINYGYIIKALPLNDLRVHDYHRFGLSTPEENLRLHELLDLDSDISDEERIATLREILQTKMILKIQSINTEEDLSNELRRNPSPLLRPAVKQRLNLE
jgi:hypothetical protein